jgi:SAM-dependent methyltransferase
MSSELTDRDFWNKYWENLELPSEVDLAHSFDRCLSRKLESVTRGLSGEIFEIGCAPGKWIGHLAKINGLVPSGIEYTDRGLQATHENFEMLQIQPGTIMSGDFFSIEPYREFDIVMSLGFIEHFEDTAAVVQRHLLWLKKGGLLILGVPNFSGLNRIIQNHLDSSLLDKHNLEIMNTVFFENLATEFGLQKISIDYLGSFEPDLPIPKVRFGNTVQLFIKLFLYVARRIRKIRLMDRFNSPYFSSYILAVYRK